MTHTLGTETRPLRVAIIGAGPAGLYTADALLKQKELHYAIDIFDHLPTPYGLVRDGVAPDHQSIKSVIRVFERILENPCVRYFGNVTIGTDLEHEELTHLYDQIVYAVGAQSDRRMGIPGEDLTGSYPATAFVGWYNGTPRYRDLSFDLSHERVVVIGNGNVAMDVTRILVKDPDQLAQSDIADYALEQLRKSSVREVVMLGRRGPVQAAFTHTELKEFGELEGVRVIVDPADLELDHASSETLATDRMAKRNYDTLVAYAQAEPKEAPRTIRLRFLTSPVEVLGTEDRMHAVRVERNQLVVDEVGGLRARGIGSYETIDAGLILRAVGYRTSALPGVPFDDNTSTIMNVAGRIVDTSGEETPCGSYVVGWAKRGPSGIIGTNKADAVATVAAMVADVDQLEGISDENRDGAAIIALLNERRPNYVTYEDWKILDRYELESGAAAGRPRIKVTSVPEMLEIIAREAKAR